MTTEPTSAELFDELVERARKLDGPDMVVALQEIVDAFDRGMKNAKRN